MRGRTLLGNFTTFMVCALAYRRWQGEAIDCTDDKLRPARLTLR